MEERHSALVHSAPTQARLGGSGAFKQGKPKVKLTFSATISLSNFMQKLDMAPPSYIPGGQLMAGVLGTWGVHALGQASS